MSKDPAFLFYPNDYIGGTMGMTFEEKGAYMELLMMQFNRGHMTSHMIGQTVGQLWDNIQDKFKEDKNGLWYNERLEQEQEKRKTYTESRRNNKEGVNQYTKKTGHTTSHMDGHMENEDVNENKDKNKEKKGHFSFHNSFISLGVEKEVLDDWLKVRQNKKATNTKTVFNMIKKQIEISDKTPNECIKLSAQNSWAGFKAEWINQAPKTTKLKKEDFPKNY